MVDTTSAEVGAAFTAVKAYLNANVPAFERSMITDDEVRAVVAVAIGAADQARASVEKANMPDRDVDSSS
jgi:hypothetical protein